MADADAGKGFLLLRCRLRNILLDGYDIIRNGLNFVPYPGNFLADVLDSCPYAGKILVDRLHGRTDLAYPGIQRRDLVVKLRRGLDQGICSFTFGHKVFLGLGGSRGFGLGYFLGSCEVHSGIGSLLLGSFLGCGKLVRLLFCIIQVGSQDLKFLLGGCITSKQILAPTLDVGLVLLKLSRKSRGFLNIFLVF